MRTSGLIAIAAMVLGAAAQEVISDLTASSLDEGQAREIKKDQFWRPLLQAAEQMQIPEHLQLCSETEAWIAQLPEGNEYVRNALEEVAVRLRRANEALLRQAATSAQVAGGKLAQPVGAGLTESFWSAEDLFSRAVRHFVGEHAHADRLVKDVVHRQADVLPVLKGAAAMVGSPLEDCRLAAKRSFDVLKFMKSKVYHKGVPMTPKHAEVLARSLIEAAGKTQRNLSSFITTMVRGITRDFQGKSDSPTATVVQSALKKSLIAQVQRSPDSMEQLINL